MEHRNVAEKRKTTKKVSEVVIYVVVYKPFPWLI